MFYRFAYYIVKLLSLIFFPYTVIGKENIPPGGGCIFASNHLSNLDPLMIGLCAYRKTTYLAKDTLFKNKILGTILRWCEAFPIRRGESDVRAIRECMRRLKKGLPVVVFPEGTRQRQDSEIQAEEGIGFLAARAGVPVVPVKVFGTDKVMPPKSRWLKRHPITLTFGEPLTFQGERDYKKIANEIMWAIRDIG